MPAIPEKFEVSRSRRLAGRYLITRVLLAATISVGVIHSSGCCSFPTGNNTGFLVDKMFTCYRDRVWAARAYTESCGGRVLPFADHHRNGFIQGYCDVCRGGDGYVPAIAPKEYWSSQYQSEHGAGCVDAWFKGYPEGALAARQDNAGRFSDIHVSQMANAAVEQLRNDKILPSDVRVVDNSSLDRLPGVSPVNPVNGSERGPLALPTRDWSQVFPGSKSKGGGTPDLR